MVVPPLSFLPYDGIFRSVPAGADGPDAARYLEGCA